jgi:hypothetical protein
MIFGVISTKIPICQGNFILEIGVDLKNFIALV